MLSRKSLLQCEQQESESAHTSYSQRARLNPEPLTHLVPLTLFEPTAANQLSNETIPSVPSSSTKARDCASISATDSDCKGGVTHTQRPRNECAAQQSPKLTETTSHT
jgi:hypothetical protein